jgi:hypothetical protein
MEIKAIRKRKAEIKKELGVIKKRKYELMKEEFDLRNELDKYRTGDIRKWVVVKDIANSVGIWGAQIIDQIDKEGKHKTGLKIISDKHRSLTLWSCRDHDRALRFVNNIKTKATSLLLKGVGDRDCREMVYKILEVISKDKDMKKKLEETTGKEAADTMAVAELKAHCTGGTG